MNDTARSQDAAHLQDIGRPQDANPLKDAAFLQAIAHLQEAARPQEGEDQQAPAEVKTYGGGFWRVTFFDEVDSTNNCVKEAISKGAPEGICFVANRQTAAYGRQGRSWKSPEGGLYFSFILDPMGEHLQPKIDQSALPTLSLLLSLAVQETLASFAQTEKIKIKWPNDILVVSGEGSAKLVGISLEMIGGKLCCGIGINITSPSGSAEDVEAAGSIKELGVPAAYLESFDALSGVTFDQISGQLLPALLGCIQGFYELWREEGIEPFMDGYNSLLYNKGEQVELETIDGELLYAGEVIGASSSGELLLRTEQGRVIAANSGEVHTRHSLM